MRFETGIYLGMMIHLMTQFSNRWGIISTFLWLIPSAAVVIIFLLLVSTTEKLGKE